MGGNRLRFPFIVRTNGTIIPVEHIRDISFRDYEDHIDFYNDEEYVNKRKNEGYEVYLIKDIGNIIQNGIYRITGVVDYSDDYTGYSVVFEWHNVVLSDSKHIILYEKDAKYFEYDEY